jgi:O-antigen ligase
LAINGSLLAFQGLLQRMDGGNKLLCIQETRMNRDASAQFGPYAYRSNAAQYFNLLWPAILGFWWWLELRCRELGTYKTLHRQLLPLASLMAVCPFISLSRAGALVALATGFLAALVLLASWPGSKRRLLLAFLSGGMILLGVAAFFNGTKLAKRFETSSKDLYEGRGDSYETGWKMAREYPVFGTGPGTLDPLFQIYRQSTEDYWPVQLHNDWLETVITFGSVGMGVVVIMLALVTARWLATPHGAVPWPFGALVGIGLGSCLAFAVVDFPFQIYSILFLFLLLCAILLATATVNAAAPRKPMSVG